MVIYETHCASCGTPLVGRQRRTCSPRCRKAIQRESVTLRTCTLCGQPFMPSGPGRRSVCPYEDADFYCQSLQNDAEDASVALRALRDAAVCECGCGAPLPYAGRGRPPKFASAACRTRAYRRAAQS